MKIEVPLCFLQDLLSLRMLRYPGIAHGGEKGTDKFQARLQSPHLYAE